ncbi:glycosyltransferase involved in cell wall biosynthesis [Orenia metallireducens]|uniref:glycosyltransferase family 4 protein n=1 Tax=Orenia metallireducens TaxID=1413210 RepID=UPI000D082959|nr:glycosyltransferase family 4 protein [Orenia metallireducens]PRX35678.1 glycosyltransferase involved in cell wall biosynthesis [Orenia metallireducens]
MKKVYILHEYGEPRHFKAVDYLKEKGKLDEIIYLEFNVIKAFMKGIIKFEINKSLRAIRNLILIIKLLFLRNQNIILGMAPYDKFIFIANILANKHDIFYFTSWPYWGRNKQPKNYLIGNKIIYKQWERFLQKVKKVTVTKKAGEELKRNGFGNFIYNIPHCVEVERFYPRNDFLEFNKKELKVLYVGRLVEEKGLQYIKEVIYLLSKEDFEFNIVGDGPDKDILDEVFLLSNVNYFGKVKDKNKLARIFRNNDMLILPSYEIDIWEELFGIVIIEAMASGLTVISTDCIGPKEIIDNNINGFLIPQKNSVILKERLEKVYNNRDLLNHLKKNAFEKAMKEYKVEVCAHEWEKALGINK